jgi:predicted HTH transcriptional regulator
MYNVFDKNFDELSYNDINFLITNKISESDVLEYKFTFPKKNDHLIKNLYAFANTKGGYLIVGIKEHPELEVIGVSKGENTLNKVNQILSLFKEERLLKYKLINIPDNDNRVIVIFKVLPSDIPLISPRAKKIFVRINQQNFISDIQKFYHFKLKKESDITREIYFLLNHPECEFLDFKYEMYKIFPKNSKLGLKQRKEFIKDLLSLINNKREENDKGIAYIIIGVGETNEFYNGIHKNIEFKNYQTSIQIINEYIDPKFNIDFIEFYISGDEKEILIKESRFVGYDRNIMIKIRYEPGTIYEIKKEIGNIKLGVSFYYPGLSFTRDLSYTRWLLQHDRERIFKLRELLD